MIKTCCVPCGGIINDPPTSLLFMMSFALWFVWFLWVVIMSYVLMMVVFVFPLKITAKWLTFLASHIPFKSFTWKKSLKRQGEYKREYIWYILDVFVFTGWSLKFCVYNCSNFNMYSKGFKLFSWYMTIHSINYCICVINFVLWNLCWIWSKYKDCLSQCLMFSKW